MWTSRTSLWWPRSHTVAKKPGLEIHIEPLVGGRVFERAADGVEHDWGEVTAWEPPERISVSWHLFLDPSQATDLTISFAGADSGTLVWVEHAGFERLGATGVERRLGTRRVWTAIGAL